MGPSKYRVFPPAQWGQCQTDYTHYILYVIMFIEFSQVSIETFYIQSFHSGSDHRNKSNQNCTHQKLHSVLHKRGRTVRTSFTDKTKTKPQHIRIKIKLKKRQDKIQEKNNKNDYDLKLHL